MTKNILELYLKYQHVRPNAKSIDLLFEHYRSIGENWHNRKNYYLLLDELFNINDSTLRAGYIKLILISVYFRYEDYDFSKLNYKLMRKEVNSAKAKYEKDKSKINEVNLKTFLLRDVIRNDTPKTFKLIKEICVILNINFQDIIKQLENDEVLFFTDHFKSEIEGLYRAYSGRHIQENNDNHESIFEEFDKITAGKKYEYLNQIGLFNLEYFKGDAVTQTKKHEIISKILGVGIRTAKGIYNKEVKYMIPKDTIQLVKDDLF